MDAKASSEKRHALRRLRERFGICLSENDYYLVINRIQNNKAKFLDRQSNRVTIWELPVQGQDVVFFYDKVRKCLITAMPTVWYGKNTYYATSIN